LTDDDLREALRLDAVAARELLRMREGLRLIAANRVAGAQSGIGVHQREAWVTKWAANLLAGRAWDEDAVAVCASYEAPRAKVERLRRGLEAIHAGVDRRVRTDGILTRVNNLLAGREWDDDGEEG